MLRILNYLYSILHGMSIEYPCIYESEDNIHARYGLLLAYKLYVSCIHGYPKSKPNLHNII